MQRLALHDHIGPGWGPAKNIVFEGNYYAGHHIDRPDDLTGKVAPPGGTPKLDWAEPEFDPAYPEGFDAFLVKHRAWMMRLFERQFGKPVRLGR